MERSKNLPVTIVSEITSEGKINTKQLDKTSDIRGITSKDAPALVVNPLIDLVDDAIQRAMTIIGAAKFQKFFYKFQLKGPRYKIR